MGPKKRAARKRKTEEALEGENEGEPAEREAEQRADRRRKERGNKKYIGAHVGIQGKLLVRLS